MTRKHLPKNKASIKIASIAINTALACMLACIAPLSPAQSARAKSPSASQAPAPTLPEPALNKLAGSVALYPDALLAQVLMAATYPLDVAEAARLPKKPASPKSSKATASSAAAGKRWQASVKALLPFPALLTMLDSQKKWTRDLAAAVNDDRANLLDTIQLLRQRAFDNGTLHATREQLVERQDRAIIIKPADTRHVSLPYYDPALAFGAAPDTLLPPEYRAAQSRFAPQNKPTGSGETFGLAVFLQDRGFYDAEIDWRRAELMVRHSEITADSISSGPAIWHHDPHYRTRPPSSNNNGAAGANGSSVGTENTPSAGSISTGTAGAIGNSAGNSIGTSTGTGSSTGSGNGQQIGTQPVRPQRR